MSGLPDSVRTLLADHVPSTDDDGLMSCSCGVWITPWRWSNGHKEPLYEGGTISDVDRWLMHLDREYAMRMAA